MKQDASAQDLYKAATYTLFLVVSAVPLSFLGLQVINFLLGSVTL